MADALEWVKSVTSLNGCGQYTAIRAGGVADSGGADAGEGVGAGGVGGAVPGAERRDPDGAGCQVAWEENLKERAGVETNYKLKTSGYGTSESLGLDGIFSHDNDHDDDSLMTMIVVGICAAPTAWVPTAPRPCPRRSRGLQACRP